MVLHMGPHGRQSIRRLGRASSIRPVCGDACGFQVDIFAPLFEHGVFEYDLVTFLGCDDIWARSRCLEDRRE